MDFPPVLDKPAPERVDSALALLELLGAVRDGRVTPLGQRIKQLPLHPRLGCILLEAHASHEAALACAMLSERRMLPSGVAATTSSDLLSAIDREHMLPPHVREVARRLAQMKGTAEADLPIDRETALLRAICAGYPDRVARRRAPGSPRFLLASGHGAVLGRESGVRGAEFIVAVDVQAGRRGETGEATIRLASAIDLEWIRGEAGGLRRAAIDHQLDSVHGRVRAIEREYYGEIVLAERPADVDSNIAARLLAEAYLAREWSDRDAQMLRRLRFAALPVDPEALVRAAAAGRNALDEIDLRASLERPIARDLERLAPETLTVPSGRVAKLRYQEDGSVLASVKLQELFGLSESPRLGPRRQPVVFELLAPNGRPVQTTRDLRSFWDTTYPEVRKELRGRYPKHPWPDDPWTATPTARAKRRGRSENNR